jgi:hypothetical protein
LLVAGTGPWADEALEFDSRFRSAMEQPSCQGSACVFVDRQVAGLS